MLFILQTGRFPAKAAADKPFTFTIKLRNAGYASPFNPRPVHLIFRSKSTGAEYKLSAHADPRTWFPGEQTWTDTLTLPRDMPAGNYDLFLALPDKSDRLAANPAYSIRLANADCWEPGTGYNRLGAIVDIAAAPSGK